jgi:7,8-dihydroneopterin aldolase/epimerase/oxygenase
VTDRLALRGLRARGRHGVLPAERASGQDFVVDVELRFDTAAAAAADDLAATVDYGTLAAAVTAVVGGEPVDLIETLAQRVADRCLAEPLVEEVEVTVHKPQAPLTVPFDDVTVTITRSR